MASPIVSPNSKGKKSCASLFQLILITMIALTWLSFVIAIALSWTGKASPIPWLVAGTTIALACLITSATFAVKHANCAPPSLNSNSHTPTTAQAFENPPDAGSNRPKVFISHSHDDIRRVEEIAIALERGGADVWLDRNQLIYGTSLTKSLREALDGADVILVFISRASIRSEWVQREADIATTREIAEQCDRVIPVLLDDIDVPWFLSGKLCANMTTPMRSQDELPRLIRSIWRLANQKRD